MATRRIQGTWVDHGAQYIAPKSDAFDRFVRKLCDRGILQVWTRSVYELRPDGLHPPAPDSMYPRYCAPSGLTAVAKDLARECRILLQTRIVSVSVRGDRWHLAADDGSKIVAKVLVSTMPAPQFVPLFAPVLATAPAMLRAVQSVEYTSCLAIMAGYPPHYPLPEAWWAVRCLDDPIVRWIGLDSSKHADTSKQPVFVFQSTADFALQTLEESNLEVAGRPVLERMGMLLAPWLAEPEWWQVHRWRFAFVREALGIACLTTEVPLPLVCAGDWCAEPNLDGAYQSGVAAAASVLELLRSR